MTEPAPERNIGGTFVMTASIATRTDLPLGVAVRLSLGVLLLLGILPGGFAV